MPKAADPIRIMVLQRGWVLVGRHSQTGQIHKLTDASVIRFWGTTRGLGEIASGGPTGTTKLDPCPPVSAHELTIVFLMDVEQDKWASRLR